MLTVTPVLVIGPSLSGVPKLYRFGILVLFLNIRAKVLSNV